MTPPQREARLWVRTLGREAFTARVHRDWREKREALRTLGLVQQ